MPYCQVRCPRANKNHQNDNGFTQFHRTRVHGRLKTGFRLSCWGAIESHAIRVPNLPSATRSTRHAPMDKTV